MRTIKFRGIDTMSGEMVYGDLDQQELADGSITTAIVQTYATYDVDPETVGQFTGLHDKNGKGIYEGDVLKNNLSDNPFGVVTWHKDGYFFIDCEFGKYPIKTNFRPLGEMLVLKLDYVKDVTFEIIGNIYEKPVLTKGGAE